MKACKLTASMGATATATDSKSAAKSDAAEERKLSRKGKKPKDKLAVKSNGTVKPKTTHDLSDVTRGLAVMSIVAEEMSEEDEELALLNYQDVFWMDNFKGVYDKPSVLAIRKKATENWKSFNDSDKAPYVAIARATEILIAKAYELKKTLVVTHMMTNLKM